MSRIRSIHPGIYTDEAFMTLTVECPLAIPLLLGLWSEADDAGSFEWKPLTIKARILPAAPVNVIELLSTLVGTGFIMEYEVDGRRFGAIRNFVKYQRPKEPKDIHPSTSESRAYAGFNSDGTRPNAATGRRSPGTTSEPLPKSPGTTSEISAQRKEEGGRMKGKEKEESASAASSGAAAAAEPDFESECRNLVGEEPVLLALDFHKLRSLVDIGAVTEADVKAGIQAAMAKPDFRIKHWSQLEGWARGAAKARMETRAKAIGPPVLAPKPAPQPMTPERWRAALEHFCTGGAWPGRSISPEPGQRGCLVPREILEEFRPRLRRVISPESFAALFEAEFAGAAE